MNKKQFQGQMHMLSSTKFKQMASYKENHIYEDLYKFAKSKEEKFVKYLDGIYKNNEQAARELASSINDDLLVDFSVTICGVYVCVEKVDQYLRNLGKYKLVFKKERK